MRCVIYGNAPTATAPHAIAEAFGRSVTEPRCGYKPAYPMCPQDTPGAGEGDASPFDPPPVSPGRTGWSGVAALVTGIALFAIFASMATIAMVTP